MDAKNENKPDERARVVAIDLLVPWAGNPRKTFHDRDGLVASVKSEGVLQSPLVRPSGKRFEVICGGRRLRAAQEASLAALEVIVREDLAGDDDAALRVNLTENLQREDVHPLEEADGLARLHEHRSVEEIAADLGRPTSYVYRRLRLLSLTEMSRAAYADGKMTGAAAELLARIDDPKAQNRACEEALAARHGAGEICDAGDVRDVLSHALMKLSTARWALDDGELVPQAGACSVCPKRTGAQAVLFDEAADDDRCTDPGCWSKKIAADAARRIEEAKARGAKVATPDEAKKVYPQSYSGSSWELTQKGLVDLDHSHERYNPSGKTWRKILGKRSVETTVVKNPHTGAVHELVREDALKKALASDPKKSDPVVGARSSGSPAKSKQQLAKEKRDKAIDKAKGAAAAESIASLVSVVEAGSKDALGFLRLIVEHLLLRTYGAQLEAVARRRDSVGKSPTYDREPLLTWLATATVDQTMALGVELAVADGLPIRTTKDGPSVAERALAAAGIDWLKIEKRAIDAATTALDAKVSKVSKKSASKSAKSAKSAPAPSSKATKPKPPSTSTASKKATRKSAPPKTSKKAPSKKRGA